MIYIQEETETCNNLHLLSVSPSNADCPEIPQMHPWGFLYSFHLIWSHAACPALHILFPAHRASVPESGMHALHY